MCYDATVRATLSAVVLLGTLGWLGSNPAQLELAEGSRVYAPEQAIKVRLTNRDDKPIYFITEVRSGAQTARGSRLPGLPVYERRRQKSFFRSERWVYSTSERARFRAAALAPSDSVTFTVNFSRPDKYKVHVGFWRQEDVGDAEAFLKLDVQQISKRYGGKLRWTSTPSFRVLRATPSRPAK